MEFFLDVDGDKRFEVEFDGNAVRMKFICGENELVFHPQAFQKLVMMSIETSSALLQLLQGFPVLLRERLFHNVYLYVRSPCHMVHIQKFAGSYGILSPTNEGIALSTLEWLKLLDIITQLKNAHVVFNFENLCLQYHSSQEEKEQCYNCHSDVVPSCGIFQQNYAQNHNH